MKFPSSRAAYLYERDPSDHVGIKEAGIAWAGLYMRGPDMGGEILVQQDDGFIQYFDYDNDEEIRKAWLNFERSLEIRKPTFYDAHCIFEFAGRWWWMSPTTLREGNEDEIVWSFIQHFESKRDAVIAMFGDNEYDIEEYWLWDGTKWLLVDAPEEE